MAPQDVNQQNNSNGVEMKGRMLLVGLKYPGESLSGFRIETKGLCCPEVERTKAAAPLYDYDVIIINPKSYSHFIFGKYGKFSNSDRELWDLKEGNNEHDLDTIFNGKDRQAELDAALKNGTRVIWLIVPDKRIQFFGWRSLYSGYANRVAEQALSSASVYEKKSKQFHISRATMIFDQYFEKLKTDGWKYCFSESPVKGKVLAKSPEGYTLCSEITIGNSKAWLMTSPCSSAGIEALIESSLKIRKEDTVFSKYHGIFLSHNHADKPFVRKLKSSLEQHGVQEVWLDEAEIQIGDSFAKKIEDGLERTKYVAVVLSPDSIKSNWVGKELEVAMTREVKSGEVVVLPILYKKCKLPQFLEGKVYADFTTSLSYEESLRKLLRRLRK